MTTKVFCRWLNAKREVTSGYWEWRAWCIKNLLIENNPRTWMFVSSDDEVSDGVLFFSEADAMAFKLRFGL